MSGIRIQWNISNSESLTNEQIQQLIDSWGFVAADKWYGILGGTMGAELVTQ